MHFILLTYTHTRLLWPGAGFGSIRKEKHELDSLHGAVETLQAELEALQKRHKQDQRRWTQSSQEQVHKYECLEGSVKEMEREKTALWAYLDEIGLNLPLTLAKHRPKVLMEKEVASKVSRAKRLESYAEPVHVESLPVRSAVVYEAGDRRTTPAQPSIPTMTTHVDESAVSEEECEVEYVYAVDADEAPPSPVLAAPSSSSAVAGGRDEKLLPDGRRVVSYRNGTVKEVYPDGRTHVLFTNGDTKRTAPDGEVVYYYCQADTKHTTFKSGVEVYEFPNKQVGRLTYRCIMLIVYNMCIITIPLCAYYTLT